MSTAHHAVLLCVKSGGIIYAKDPLHGDVGFVFGKLQGYRGETAQELLQQGLRKGALLELEYDHFGMVTLARIAST